MHWARDSCYIGLASILWERRFDLGDVSGVQFALLVGENEHVDENLKRQFWRAPRDFSARVRISEFDGSACVAAIIPRGPTDPRGRNA
jgi:hypothetical protein